MNTGSYPPIDHYGFIADCHSAALVSRTGSIDWCCMPRIDSNSCFGRILDWEKGGYWRIAPTTRYESCRHEAHRTFQRAFAVGNDLGLFAEEYDSAADEMLGNFPQGLTHLSLISAAVALNEIEGAERSSAGSCKPN
jgi:GH15 family glucan-1,4-alpha-glucosidase